MLPRQRFLCVISVFLLDLFIAACGGGGGTSEVVGGGTPPPPQPGFTISLSPSGIDLVQAGTTASVQVSVIGQNGFSDSVTVTATGLPSGVTASPSSLSVTAGAPATLTFGASSSATPGAASINISGVSGTLSARSTLSLSIKATPIPIPFKSVGGFLRHGFYDESRQELFASNPDLNELDVISGVDLSIKARVPLPSAWGVDQMADGKTLVVGTDAQEIYTVDEDTYAVTRHPCPLSWGWIGVVYPNPIAMANGKVILISQQIGIESFNILDGGQYLIEWDSNKDTFTQLEPTAATTPWETDILARSADHKWAVFSGNTQLYLYSSDSDSLTSAPGSTVDPPLDAFGIRGYALNADGSKIAVVSSRQVTFIDQSFNVLGTVQIPDAYQNSGRAQFSIDGNRVFLFYGPTGEGVEAIDAKAFTTLGFFSGQTSHLSQDVSFLGVDSSGKLFFGDGGGVRVADSTLSPYIIPAGGDLPGTGCLTPNPFFFPLNSSFQVPFYAFGTMPAGSQIYLDGYLATLSSDRPDGLADSIEIPGSSSAGPVDMECIFANGLTDVVPAAFSYGVKPITSSANLLPPGGNPSILVFGYGLLDAPLNSKPTVTIGGSSASLLDSNANLYDGSLQGLQVKVPAGMPNEQADLQVSNANGTGTLANAISYIPSSTIIPATGISQLVFDSHRNLLYALKAQEVDVFDSATQQWQSPLQLPAQAPTLNYLVMALSPDGTKMALESSDGHLLAFNPDQPTQASLVSCAATSAVREAASLAITRTNVAVLTGPCDQAIDLTTMLSVHGSFGIGRVSASADGTHVYGIDLNIDSGDVSSIDTSTYAVQSQSFAYTFWTDLAVSPDGMQFAAVDAPPYTIGASISFFDSALHDRTSAIEPLLSYATDSGVSGTTFSPQGHVLVQPFGDSIEFWDAAQGTLRARLMTPEELRLQTSPYPPAGSQIAFDSSGQTIYAISASGLTVLKLAIPIDQMPSYPWPLAIHSGGSSRRFSTSQAGRAAFTKKPDSR